MKTVETVLVDDIQQKQRETGQTDGKAYNVDDGDGLVFPQGTEGDGEVILDHIKRLLKQCAKYSRQ